MASELNPIQFKTRTGIEVWSKGKRYIVSIRIDGMSRNETRYVVDIVRDATLETLGSIYYCEGAFQLSKFKDELVDALNSMPSHA